MYITGRQVDCEGYGMDPRASVEFNISHDRTVVRHDFNGHFGSAIGSKAVSSGQWYFEVEILSTGFYQIGWVNDRYVPKPDMGEGVGDDEHSWAIDLYRHARWHKTTEHTRLSYAPDVTWQIGGIVQVFLDLTNHVMSFGYDGRDLGPAFTDFEIGAGLKPAVSTNLENECRFNFGASTFKYPLLAGYLPLRAACYI